MPPEPNAPSPISSNLFLGGIIGRTGTSFVADALRIIVPEDVIVLGELGVFPLEQIRGAPRDLYEAPPHVENRKAFLSYFSQFVGTIAYDRSIIYGRHLAGFRRYIPEPSLLNGPLSELSALLSGNHSETAIAEIFGRFYTRALDVCAECSGKRRWISKDPGYGRFLADLHGMIPDGRVVIMAREACDVVASMIAKGWDGGDPDLCLRRLCDSTARTLRAIDRVPPSKVLVVKYELLVSEPRATFERILAFYGIEQTAAASNWSQVVRSTRRESVGKGRGLLSASLLRRIETETAPMWKLLGYPL